MMDRFEFPMLVTLALAFRLPVWFTVSAAVWLWHPGSPRGPYDWVVLVLLAVVVRVRDMNLFRGVLNEDS